MNERPCQDMPTTVGQYQAAQSLQVLNRESGNICTLLGRERERERPCEYVCIYIYTYEGFIVDLGLGFTGRVNPFRSTRKTSDVGFESRLKGVSRGSISNLQSATRSTIAAYWSGLMRSH